MFFYLEHLFLITDYEDEPRYKEISKGILLILDSFVIEKLQNYDQEISFDNSYIFLHFLERMTSILRDLCNFDSEDVPVFENIFKLKLLGDSYYQFMNDIYLCCLLRGFDDESGYELFYKYSEVNNRFHVEDLFEYSKRLIQILNEKGLDTTKAEAVVARLQKKK
jgi:hypothetical protein